MTPSIRMATALLTTALALTPLSTFAHDVEKGPNGGPIVTVADKHLELTTAGPAIVVFLTDAKHEPIAATGATGRAVVQSGGKTTTVALAAGEGNRLTGTSEAPLAKGARVVVSASLASGGTLQARFVVP